MDQETFFDIGKFNPNEVDLDAVPSSAEAYLKQVKASRIRLAEVVAIKRPEAVPSTAGDASSTASDAVTSTSLQNAFNPSPSTSDPLAPSIEWQTAKCEQFERNRNRIEAIFSNPEFRKKIPKKSWQPSKFIEDSDEWRGILLERCHPTFASQQQHFPNHTGTPPALHIVASLYSYQVDGLLESFVSWAEEESLTRPIREWIYALLLLVVRPPIPDVVTALRTLVRMCRKIRNSLSQDREDEIREFSLFIAIVARNFGQMDLADD